MTKVIITSLLAVGIIVAMLVESTLVALPLVYLIGAFLLIFMRRVRIYLLVFLLAFFVDSLRVTNFGLTPLFLLGVCAIIFLYEKFSGSDDKIISSFFIAVSALVYAHYLSYSVGWTILALMAAAIAWLGIHRFTKERFSL